MATASADKEISPLDHDLESVFLYTIRAVRFLHSGSHSKSYNTINAAYDYQSCQFRCAKSASETNGQHHKWPPTHPASHPNQALPPVSDCTILCASVSIYERLPTDMQKTCARAKK